MPMNFKGHLARKWVQRGAQQQTQPTPAMDLPVAPVIPQKPQWNAVKFKVELKKAKSRLEVQKGKKENEVSSTRYLIADQIRSKKESLARIHVEKVLRARTELESYETVMTFADLLASQHLLFQQISDFDSCGEDLKQSVASLVYSARRLNIPELHTVTSMFCSHFGNHIIEPIAQQQGPNVKYINKTLARKLDSNPPDGYLILNELDAIARENGLKYEAPPEDSHLDGGNGPSDPGYYRPVRPPMNVPGMGGHNNHFGGPGNGGGDMGMMPPPIPMNIPGMPGPPPLPPMSDPYGNSFSQSPYSMSNPPSAPPSAPPAPHAPSAPPPSFDPSHNATGTLYPYPDMNPPNIPGSANPDFLSDDVLTAKYNSLKDK